MSKKKETEEQRFRRLFPTSNARDAADKAIDAIPTTEPMTAFLDAWIKAYLAAGGVTSLKFD